VLREAGDIADEIAAILRLHHPVAILLADRDRPLLEDRVATSPGHTQVERMPLTHSSMLIEWLMATAPCLAAT